MSGAIVNWLGWQRPRGGLIAKASGMDRRNLMIHLWITLQRIRTAVVLLASTALLVGTTCRAAGQDAGAQVKPVIAEKLPTRTPPATGAVATPVRHRPRLPVRGAG